MARILRDPKMATKIFKLRQYLQLAQWELAQLIGCSQVSICRFEQDKLYPGKKTREKLQKLANNAEFPAKFYKQKLNAVK